MATLRKMAQPMMKSRIYPFIKSIIGRWPLDSSLSVVLELWLSYIQPWRYRFEWQNNRLVQITLNKPLKVYITIIILQLFTVFQTWKAPSIVNLIRL